MMADKDDIEVGSVYRTYNVRDCRWSGLENMAERTDGVAVSGSILLLDTPESAREFMNVCDSRARTCDWAGYPAVAEDIRDLRDRIRRAVPTETGTHVNGETIDQ